MEFKQYLEQVGNDWLSIWHIQHDQWKIPYECRVYWPTARDLQAAGINIDPPRGGGGYIYPSSIDPNERNWVQRASTGANRIDGEIGRSFIETDSAYVISGLDAGNREVWALWVPKQLINKNKLDIAGSAAMQERYNTIRDEIRRKMQARQQGTTQPQTAKMPPKKQLGWFDRMSAKFFG